MITEEEKQFCINVSDISLGPIEAKYNTVELCRELFEAGIDGDLVEAGVFAGCHPIIMSMMVRQFNQERRRVHMIDSFQGIPKVLDTEHEHDQKVYGVRKPGEAITSSGISNVDLAGVKGYVIQFKGYSEVMVYHPGWFQDTLPNIQIDKIALLRVDGDLVESLTLCLQYLYPKLVSGGYFVCDDYMSETCKKVINDFLLDNKISTDTIIGPEKSIIYWKKP
jgi:hypothetical protein